ncbi:hypothetical protein GGD55_004445 [Rhizobium giardinii]|uniref:Uncharacterized protein n=1 Tax=Rhizobium giardinii TaxID=56731 RepID=A0A7W8X8W7_9HYPH|nr:hypothetical protein [Rhizobium giardinii]
MKVETATKPASATICSRSSAISGSSSKINIECAPGRSMI